MRRRILQCIIWVYTVSISSIFECIQHVPHMSTFNFRLATGCQSAPEQPLKTSKTGRLGVLSSGVNQVIDIWMIKISRKKMVKKKKIEKKLHIISSLLQMSLFFSKGNLSKDIKISQNMQPVLRHFVAVQVTWLFCQHHHRRWSTSEYSSTDVLVHLISVLPLWSKRSREMIS